MNFGGLENTSPPGFSEVASIQTSGNINAIEKTVSNVCET
jgi:hypothetical protein